MAGPITWQNVNTPRSGGFRQMDSVGGNITAGIDSMVGAIRGVQQDKATRYDKAEDKNTDNYLDYVAGINTLDGLNSDGTNTQLEALRNAGPIDQDAIRNAVNTQRTGIMDRTNVQDTFDLGQAKKASRPLLENIDQFVAKEDLVGLRAYVTENQDALRLSGDLSKVSTLQSGLDDKLELETGARLQDELLRITAGGKQTDLDDGIKFLEDNKAEFGAVNGLGAAETSLAGLETKVDTQQQQEMASTFRSMLAGSTPDSFVAAQNYLDENSDFLTRQGVKGNLRNELLLASVKMSDKQQEDDANRALVEDEAVVTRAVDALALMRENNPTDQLTSVEELEDFAAVDLKAADGGWDTSESIGDEKATKIYQNIIAEETPTLTANANTGKLGDARIQVPVNVQRGLMMQAVGDLGKATDSWYRGENDIDDVKKDLRENYQLRIKEWFKQKENEIKIQKSEELVRIARETKDQNAVELNRKLSERQLKQLKAIMGNSTPSPTNVPSGNTMNSAIANLNQGGNATSSSY